MVRALLNILLINPIYTIACAVAAITALSACLAFISGLKAGVRDAVFPMLVRGVPHRDRTQNPVVTVTKDHAETSDVRQLKDAPDVSINSFSYDPETNRIVMTVADTLGEEDAEK